MKYIRKTWRFIISTLHKLKNFSKKPAVYSKPVIYFDISNYSQSNIHTGIQRVVENFMNYFPAIAIDYEVVYIRSKYGYYQVSKDTYDIDYEVKLCPHKGDIYFSLDFNPDGIYQNLNTLKKWQKNGCKLVACVYDLVYEKYPEYVVDSETVHTLSRWLYTVCKEFDELLCISKTVENELRQWMQEKHVYNKHLVTDFFYLGSDFDKNKNCNTEIETIPYLDDLKNKGIVFLAVSTIEPRKGFYELIGAFEDAVRCKENIYLIIVGHAGWKCKETVAKILNSKYYNKNIFWEDDCDDWRLKSIYNNADYYISNSYYEGFGLGIIEAAHYGLPLLLRDIPIYREIAKNKAIYYKNKLQLTQKMLQIKKTEKTTENTITPISWKESVDMAYNALKKCEENKR